MSVEQLRGIFEEELMTTSEVVRFLKISRATLYRRLEDRAFPEPIKASKRTQYWLRSELKKYMKDCEANGVPV